MDVVQFNDRKTLRAIGASSHIFTSKMDQPADPQQIKRTLTKEGALSGDHARLVADLHAHILSCIPQGQRLAAT